MLTPFAKVVLFVILVGVLLGGLYWLGKNPDVAEKVASGLGKTAQQATGGNTAAPAPKRDAGEDVFVALLNTWGGQAGSVYMNNGQKEPSTDSKFYTEFGQLVKLEVSDDFAASRAGLISGAYDILCFATVGEFSIEAASLEADGVKVVCQYDKSYGGDALVVREGINSVKDLLGKTIALAPGSPSHGLFMNLIRVSGYTQADVNSDPSTIAPNKFNVIEVKDGLDAADFFRKEKVDAAFVWSPDDAKLPREVADSKVLMSTKSAPDIIMDVMLVKESVAKSKRQAVKNFIAGWLYGNAKINTSNQARQEAVQGMVNVFGLPEPDWTNLTIAKLMTLGDNLNFFGLNTSYKGVTGEELYSRMGDEYSRLKIASGEPLVSGKVPSWREVSDPSFIRELQNNPKLVDKTQLAEAPRQFSAPTAAQIAAPAITTTRITVEYAFGSAELTSEAKKVIKRDFGSLARGFSEAYIRVEGNTDNVGSAESNKALSLRRAEAVKSYLVSTYDWQSKRIVTVGNGLESPVADNGTEDGRARNRRTDFEIMK